MTEGSSAVSSPYFSYRPQRQRCEPGESMHRRSSSSIAGLSFAFVRAATTRPTIVGGLYFADFSRDCIWQVPHPRARMGCRTCRKKTQNPSSRGHRIRSTSKSDPRRRPLLRRPPRRRHPPRRLRRCRPEYVPGRPVPGAVLPQHDPDRGGGLSALRTCAAEPRLGGRRSGRRRRRRVLGPLDRTDELPLEQHLHVHRRDRRRHAGVDRRPGPHRPVAQPAGHVHGVQGADGGQPRHTHRLFRDQPGRGGEVLLDRRGDQRATHADHHHAGRRNDVEGRGHHHLQRVGDRPGGRRPAGQQPVVGDGPPALPRRLSRPPVADLVGGERGIDHRAGSRVPGLPGTPPDRDGQERPDRDRQQATGSADPRR